MPDWTIEVQTAPFLFVDVLLELCHFFPGYTVDSLLDQPVKRVWMMVQHLSAHREQLAQAAKDNPMAAFMLMGGF